MIKISLKKIVEQAPFFAYVLTMYEIAFSVAAFSTINRWQIAPLVLFPFSVIALYLFVEFYKNEDNKREFFLHLAAHLAIVCLLIFLTPRFFTDLTESSKYNLIKSLYEISSILMALLLAIHGFIYRDCKDFVVLFVLSAFYGFLLESGGVRMGFFSEDGYHLYLPPFSAPIATMIGWSSVFYSSLFIVERSFRYDFSGSFLKVILYSTLIGIVATFMDVPLDPVAVDLRLWSWSKELDAFLFDVPLINYTSWFFAVFSFGLFYHAYSRWFKQRFDVKDFVILLLIIPLIQLIAAILNFTTIAVIEGKNSPSINILIEYIKNSLT